MRIPSATRREPRIRRGSAGAVVAVLALLATGVPRSRAADLHAFWDDRCAECHRHAGEFARNHLTLKDGRLVGSKPKRDVCAFLVTHGAGEALAAPICAMLSAQAATPSLFRDKCAACHGTAAELARAGLATAPDGTVHAKSGGREIADFLASHGGLAVDEIPHLAATLRRVLGEVQQRPER